MKQLIVTVIATLGAGLCFGLAHAATQQDSAVKKTEEVQTPARTRTDPCLVPKREKKKSEKSVVAPAPATKK